MKRVNPFIIVLLCTFFAIINCNTSDPAENTENTNKYTIFAIAGSGGTISPSGSISVKDGDDLSFTITPTSGYAISSVLIDGINNGAISSYTFNNISTNHTISAHFYSIALPQYYMIIAAAGTGGSISPSGSVSVEEGENQTFTITPSSGYTISNVLIDGVDNGALSSYTFNKVYTDHFISASFISTSPQHHTIVATASTGGTISPNGSVSVEDGDDQTFTITPSSGYTISNVLVDGIDQGIISSYTFNNVITAHTINANFTAIAIPTLSVSTDDLLFQAGYSMSNTFTISNSGTGTLTWSIAKDVSWITSISPISGTNSGTITVTVSYNGLSVGWYYGKITITSNGGEQVIFVRLNVWQKTWTGYADADAEVISSYPNSNFGTDTEIYVQYGGICNRAFIHFNFLNTIPSGAVITSAQLRLNQLVAYGVPFDIRIGWVSSSWSESTLTWNNQSTDFTYITANYFTISTTTESFLYFDVKTEVQRMLNYNNNNGFAIRLASESTPTKYFGFDSKENIFTYARAPYLEIKYILPEP